MPAAVAEALKVLLSCLEGCARTPGPRAGVYVCQYIYRCVYWVVMSVFLCIGADMGARRAAAGRSRERDWLRRGWGPADQGDSAPLVFFVCFWAIVGSSLALSLDGEVKKEWYW